MKKTINFFKEQLTGIHLNQISCALIENVKVNDRRIRDISSVTKSKNNIIIRFYDFSGSDIVSELKKQSFNCYLASKDTVIVSVPIFTLEEKEKIQKQVSRLGEETKVAIRNIRKEYRKKIDEKHLQKVVDSFITQVDVMIEGFK